MAHPHTSFHALLSSHTTENIPSLPSGGRMIELDSHSPPAAGFQTLLDNRILSAPVWSAEENKYVGFLDMRDFVAFVVFFYHAEAEGGCSFSNIMREGLKKYNTPVDGITVSYLARLHPFKPLPQGSSLLEVCKLLKGNVRRIPIVNDAGKVVKVISQSCIVAFVNSKIRELDAKHSVRELHLGHRPVITVPMSQPAIDVFKMMESHNLSGIAIVDEHGKLISATSARDLKGFLFNPSIHSLQTPIFDFLKKIRQEEIDIHTPTISVEETSTLAIVVGKLAATRVHRVFVVDSDRSYHPVAVISVGDVVSKLTELAEGGH